MSTDDRPIRVRMAPSPTGPLHIGTARTTLCNWLYARHTGGTFVLRIEDTDVERSKIEHTRELIEGLQWMGLQWDEGPVLAADGSITSHGPYGPYVQSERLALYRTYLEQLLNENKAYYCYCSKDDLLAEKEALAAQGIAPRYSGRCGLLTEPPTGKQPQTIRFRTPRSTGTFTDRIRGTVPYDASLLGDMVIAKDLDTPLYNFAVVVDDELMQITDVIRGEDHISNTPKQILIQYALGFRPVRYAHLPLILSSDRSKLSKRTTEVSLLSYREQGYLPDALINFLALLGWHAPGDQEVFERTELIAAFGLERVQKSGAIFNEEKLAWLNREHIRRLPFDALCSYAAPYVNTIDAPTDLVERVLRAEQERIGTLSELPLIIRGYVSIPDYPVDLLVWKKSDIETTRRIVSHVDDLLMQVPESSFTADVVAGVLQPLLDADGKGTVLWPLRVALSGVERSPDPFTLITVLGRERTLERTAAARQKLAR